MSELQTMLTEEEAATAPIHKPLTLINVFSVLSRPFALELFQKIADDGSRNSESLINLIGKKTNLKQFYGNMRLLVGAGLVKREEKTRIYQLTGLGKIVAVATHSINLGLDYRPRINYLESLAKEKIPEEHYKIVARQIIPDDKIRGIVLGA